MQSMTGYGAGRRSLGTAEAVVELRAVNGRYFKSTINVPSSLSGYEGSIERILRERLVRGSVQASVRWNDNAPGALAGLNEPRIRAYQEAFRRLGLPETQIPMLPGVLEQASSTMLSEEQWMVVQGALEDAVAALSEMRDGEGAAIAMVLAQRCDEIEHLRACLVERAPLVVREYQEKLRERVTRLLGEQLEVDSQQLAREVAFYADRSDIVEELDRLGAHVAQMRGKLTADGEVGRTLDFLAQEMHREVNTVGSKSSDSQISQIVVALKTEVERIKEQVANVA